eukprot:541109-Amphidinium_carterae.1
MRQRIMCYASATPKRNNGSSLKQRKRQGMDVASAKNKIKMPHNNIAQESFLECSPKQVKRDARPSARSARKTAGVPFKPRLENEHRTPPTF